MKYILLTWLAISPIFGQAQNDENDKKWKFVIAPYLYVPAVSGDAMINNNEAVLDSKFSPSGMLAFEAYTPKFSIYSDLLIINLDSDITMPITDRDGTLELRETFFGVYLMWKIGSWFELGPGARLIVSNTKMKVPSTRFYSEIDAEFSSVGVDPLLVYRITFLDKNNWNIKLRGDFGGFGLYSVFTYLINPSVGYNITDLLEVNLAYRLLSFYHNDEDGGDRFDMIFNGPQIGLLFHL